MESIGKAKGKSAEDKSNFSPIRKIDFLNSKKFKFKPLSESQRNNVNKTNAVEIVDINEERWWLSWINMTKEKITKSK